MKPFEITLKNEKLKQYDRIALFILIINFALFIYLALTTDIKSIKIAAIIGIAIIITALSIEYFLFSTKQNQGSIYKMFAEYGVALVWLQMGFWWIGIAIFLLGLLYMISKRPLLVSIIKEKITYPSFPKKTLSWSDLNNIVLRDGLLTIELKNDKFIQQPIDESKTSINEQDFNDFCREQLNK